MAQAQERQPGKGNGKLEVGGKGRKLESSSNFPPATDEALEEQWRVLFVEPAKKVSKRDHEVARQSIIDQATALTYDWLSTFRVITFIITKAQKNRLSQSQLRLAEQIIKDISIFFSGNPNISKWLVDERSVNTFGYTGGYRAAMRTVHDAASQVVNHDQKLLLLAPSVISEIAKRVITVSAPLLEKPPGVDTEMKGHLLSFSPDMGKTRLEPVLQDLQTQQQPAQGIDARTKLLAELPKSSIFNRRFTVEGLGGAVTLESALGQPTEKMRALAFLAFIASVPKGDAFYQEIIKQLLIGPRESIRLESRELVRLLVRMIEIVTEIGERLLLPALAQEVEKTDVQLRQQFGDDFIGFGSATREYLQPDAEFEKAFSLALKNIGSMAVFVDSIVTVALDCGRALNRLSQMPEMGEQAGPRAPSVTTNLSRVLYENNFPQQRSGTPQQAVQYVLAEFAQEILSGVRKRFPYDGAQVAQFEKWYNMAVEQLPRGIARESRPDRASEEIAARTFAESIFTRLGEASTKRLNSKAQEIAGISQEMLSELFAGSEKAYFGEVGTPRVVTFSKGSLPDKLGLSRVTFFLQYNGNTEFLLESSQDRVPALLGSMRPASGKLPECSFQRGFAGEWSGIEILLKQCVVATFCDLITRERVAPAVVVGIPVRDALVGDAGEDSSQDSEEDHEESVGDLSQGTGEDRGATGQRSFRQSPSRVIHLPRRTLEQQPGYATQGQRKHTTDTLTADIEVAQRGTRHGYTPRSVESYTRYLPGASRLKQVLEQFSGMNRDQSPEEQQELAGELQQALDGVGKPSSGKLTHFATLGPDFQKDLEPVAHPFKPGEVLYLKTTVDGYESPKVLQTVDGEISLRQSYEVRYKSGPKSRFLGALYSWFMQDLTEQE